MSLAGLDVGIALGLGSRLRWCQTRISACVGTGCLCGADGGKYVLKVIFIPPVFAPPAPSPYNRLGLGVVDGEMASVTFSLQQNVP